MMKKKVCYKKSKIRKRKLKTKIKKKRKRKQKTKSKKKRKKNNQSTLKRTKMHIMHKNVKEELKEK